MPSFHSKYLVIIDPSTRHPEIEVCQKITELTPLPHLLFRPALPQESRCGALGMSELETLAVEQIAGLIILGGGASPNDTLAWQDRLISWLRKEKGVLTLNFPILGICYGHQLLGYLAGGQVGMLWNEYCEKGLRTVSFKQMTLGLRANKNYPMIVSHREGLLSLPDHWLSLTDEAIIYTEKFPRGVQAYEMIVHRHKPWWGIQAHIDATPEFLRQNCIEVSYPKPYAGTTMIHTFLETCRKYSEISSI